MIFHYFSENEKKPSDIRENSRPANIRTATAYPHKCGTIKNSSFHKDNRRLWARKPVSIIKPTLPNVRMSNYFNSNRLLLDSKCNFQLEDSK